MRRDTAPLSGMLLMIFQGVCRAGCPTRLNRMFSEQEPSRMTEAAALHGILPEERAGNGQGPRMNGQVQEVSDQEDPE
ncbi:hypothetical protein A9R12_17485 [Aeromonas hydrophila]|nr:hypothetical protein A9R12_17485 [Aeromonas hydrophila]POR05817.1 hypothetical protein BOH68_12805 [Cobetia sp. MM1IDA2H-1]